jgi:hypothetical protein
LFFLGVLLWLLLLSDFWESQIFPVVWAMEDKGKTSDNNKVRYECNSLSVGSSQISRESTIMWLSALLHVSCYVIHEDYSMWGLNLNYCVLTLESNDIGTRYSVTWFILFRAGWQYISPNFQEVGFIYILFLRSITHLLIFSRLSLLTYAHGSLSRN